MIFEDSLTVKAPIEKVWAFLLDPQQVAQCIPGTEKIEVIDDTHYHVVAGARVSFLTMSFSMSVTVTEIDAPRRLVSVAEGSDARLKERVKLTAELNLESLGPAETALRYKIDLGVFGKLASIGFSVIKGKAKQMAADFASGIRVKLEASV